MPEAYARCWAEVDLDALMQNYRTALSFLTNGAQLICVLKANAYGLGAARAARALHTAGANFFAVACLSEALEIKHALPEADVLVLGLIDKSELKEALTRGIIFTVYSKASADALSDAAALHQITARVHIKADTGLHRLGFDLKDAGFAAEFTKRPYIKLEGLFTHLALHDRESDEKQFAEFDRFDAAFRAAGLTGYLRHACDSIGMLRYPERHMDAVRTGAWLFGVPPYSYDHPEYCLPTVAFKTRVAQIRDVAAGERIGYDDDHALDTAKRVATLSCGYVDGFPRLNNEGFVLIRGRRAGILGLICMDQMMVDVTDIPDAREGDEVTLLGGEIKVNDYARLARINHNEALARIGRRVPRVYKSEGRTEVEF